MLQHSDGSGNSQASENSNFGTTVVLLITHDIITYHHSGAPKLEKKATGKHTALFTSQRLNIGQRGTMLLLITPLSLN